MPAHSTIYRLGYLGLIPFTLGLLLIVSGLTVLGESPLRLFISYSAIILSFLGGALWGRAIQIEENTTSHRLLLLSNAAALTAWAALLFSDLTIVSLTALIIGYTSLLVVEYFGDEKLFSSIDKIQVKKYINMRVNLTSLVIVAHLIALPYSN